MLWERRKGSGQTIISQIEQSEGRKGSKRGRNLSDEVVSVEFDDGKGSDGRKGRGNGARKAAICKIKHRNAIIEASDADPRCRARIVTCP